jgi:hypothetical protein
MLDEVGIAIAIVVGNVFADPGRKMRRRVVGLRSLQLRDYKAVVFLFELVNLPGVAVLPNTKARLFDERLPAKMVEDLVRILDRNRIFKFGSLEFIVIAPAAT